MAASLAALSPADRAYVITYALTPRTVVTSSSSVVTPVHGPGQISQAASAQSAPSVQAANGQSAPSAQATVATAHHRRTVAHAAGCANYSHSFTAKSYSWLGLWQFTFYSNHQWTGCNMHGREVFGSFGFCKYAINDTADLQAQVHGDGGWWAWANITGP